jgi:hypothetical protein
MPKRLFPIERFLLAHFFFWDAYIYLNILNPFLLYARVFGQALNLMYDTLLGLNPCTYRKL